MFSEEKPIALDQLSQSSAIVEFIIDFESIATATPPSGCTATATKCVDLLYGTTVSIAKRSIIGRVTSTGFTYVGNIHTLSFGCRATFASNLQSDRVTSGGGILVSYFTGNTSGSISKFPKIGLRIGRAIGINSYVRSVLGQGKASNWFRFFASYCCHQGNDNSNH
jgi:hypothetical protein